MRKISDLGIGDKGKLLVFLAVLLVIGFTGTSLLAYKAARDGVRASIEENALPVAAESVYARLQRDLVEPIFVSSMMANDTFLHDWVLDGERTPEDMRKFLTEIQSRYNTITAFFVSERSRRYYHPSGILKLVDPDEWRDAWYWRVRAMDEPYELNVDVDLANADALTVFINYRVMDVDGEFLGAAGVGLTVDAMAGMAARLREEFGTAVYFVDPDGIIVAGMPATYQIPLPTVNHEPALRDVAMKAIKAGGGAFRYHTSEGDVLLHVRWLPEVRGFLFVEKTEAASVAGSRRALGLNLAVYTGILILVLLAATLTVDRFQSRLEHVATHDTLTGALNRLAFGAVADHAIKDARRTGLPLSVVMVDADEFKAVNDRFGHPDGDKVLNAIVGAVVGMMRQSDAFCRWGGEEFLFLLPGCDPEAAKGVAEKVRTATAETTARDCPVMVTLSAGIATLRDQEDFDTLVSRADDALLRAKRAGKNRSVIA
ncbi:MAG: sensor domain-containing diguanylate cyclase [Spirochaetota bacterium]